MFLSAEDIWIPDFYKVCFCLKCVLFKYINQRHGGLLVDFLDYVVLQMVMVWFLVTLSWCSNRAWDDRGMCGRR